MSKGDALAAPPVPRLLSLRQLLPVHPGGHALRRHRLHRLLLGGESCMYRAGDHRTRLAWEGDRPAKRVPLICRRQQRRRCHSDVCERVRAGDDAGGARAGHPPAEAAAAAGRGGLAAGAPHRLLLQGVALLRREGRHDLLRPPAHPRARRQVLPARRDAPTGDGGGRGAGPHPVLRVDDTGHHVVLLVRRPAGDRARVPQLPVRLAARGRRVRGQRLHLPRAEAAAARHRVRRLVQHQPQQVAAGELRLLDHVGARPPAADVGAGGGPAVPAARLLGPVDRLPPLGNPAVAPLPRAQAVVRAALLRHQRPAALHPAPHRARQGVRGARPQGPALRGLQRGQAGPGVLPAARLGPAQPEAAGHHQRVWPAAHGARLRQRQVRHPLLRRRPERHPRRRRPCVGRHHGNSHRAAGDVQRGERPDFNSSRYL